jgi:hypothetical protein
MLEMPGEVALSVIPNAGHVFEHPGALEDAAVQTAAWLRRWLRAVRRDL